MLVTGISESDRGWYAHRPRGSVQHEEVRIGRLVRHDHESRAGVRDEYPCKGLDKNLLVVWPGAACDERECAVAGQHAVAARRGVHAVEYGIDAWITGHHDASGVGTESGEAPGVGFANRADRRERCIAGGEHRSRRPPQPAAVFEYGRCHQRDCGSARGCTRREFGPQVELGENEQVGHERVEGCIDVANPVVG